MPTRRVLSAVAAAGLLIGCTGSDVSESTESTGATSGPPATDSSPATTGDIPGSTTTAASSTTSSITSTTTQPEVTTTSAGTTTSSTSRTSTTTAPGLGEVIDVSIPIPSGSFVAVAPGDVVVLGTDGDLELRPRLVGTTDDPAVPLVDNPDPRDTSGEGPGPNVVDDVAGFANGSLLFGDCCEPVSGNIYALTDEGTEPSLIGVGLDPDLSPDGQRLVTANSSALSVTNVADGTGRSLILGGDPRFRDVLDVQWSNDDAFALLSRTPDGEILLTTFDPASFDTTDPVTVDTVTIASDDPDSVSFAGFGPDGTTAVAVDDGVDTTIRFFAPGSMDESAEQRTLPTGVTSVEFVPSDAGLTWVDDGVLYYLAPGQFEARALATDVLAAWSPTPGLT